MTLNLSRRALAAGLLATAVTPAAAVTVSSFSETGDRLPDHAAFWAGLPLPFTPAQAWHRLDAATQAEIGAAVIGMHLAEYIYGDGRADADQFLDDDLRDRACDVAQDFLNRMGDRLDVLLPDLYGPAGDHPRWALDGGLAR